ncbi:hypothetical protein [Streptomyces sp. bgisy084]|uniref:hypothetical protein n=1 Tax=Streptomyces sp. bgisy084 TaxID=3413777 RepID=UPI003D725EA7
MSSCPNRPDLPEQGRTLADVIGEEGPGTETVEPRLLHQRDDRERLVIELRFGQERPRRRSARNSASPR